MGTAMVTTDAATEPRRWLLERIDDAAVIQLYADGFEQLPPRERVLVWHLCQAALAGRDIYLDQRCRDGLALRGVQVDEERGIVQGHRVYGSPSRRIPWV